MAVSLWCLSETGDLLVLLHGARDRYRSVRGTWRQWRHAERASAAFSAYHHGSESQPTSATVTDESQQPVESAATVRYWLRRPDHRREEREEPGGPRLIIQVAETWWTYSPAGGAVTNEGNSSQGIGIGDWLDPLLDPARVIGYLDFEIAGRGRRAGRATIEARATPRSSSGGRDPFRFALHALGTGAEEYLLSVDAQTGVLLRSELRHDGEPFSVIEALEIGFDEPLGDELFVFHAPQDVDVVPMSTRLRHRHNVPLHEAVALADFPVYVLPKVPDEWDLSVSFNARPHRTVVLWYRSRDAAATLNVAQTAVDDAEPAMRPRGAECIERDGRELYVRDRAEDWPQAQLSTTVGKTSISMNSNALGAEDLIRLTETLVPASTDPPSLA